MYESETVMICWHASTPTSRNVTDRSDEEAPSSSSRKTLDDGVGGVQNFLYRVLARASVTSVLRIHQVFVYLRRTSGAVN